MTERPDTFRARASMQDSGVSSFGSESDSSPVQQHGTVPSSAPCRKAVSIRASVTSAAMSGNKQAAFTVQQQTPERRGDAPTIAVIPQSPQYEQNKTFIYDSVLTKIDPSREGRTTGDRTFHVTYYGESVLDKRYTRPMLPWIMAEMRRKSTKHELVLEILPDIHMLQGTVRSTNEVLFRHRLPTVSSFARAYQDPTCFVYLTRTNVDSPFTCHVFQVSEESKVPHLFTAIREATKQAVKEAYHPTSASDGVVDSTAVMHSHLCEVMYVGKVVVTSKKAPPTFIDEAVEKFREHERQKCEFSEERQRHSSGASIQSLPADLEQMVSIRENEIGVQSPKGRGSNESSLNVSEEDVDSIPLGGSSSSLHHVLRNVQRQRKLSLESEIQVMSNSQDSIKNVLGQNIAQTEGQNQRSEVQDGVQKMAPQMPCQTKKNRTMLLQVGQNEITLISTDKKKVIFERKFTDISFCSQGIRHPEHFGFISRDLVNSNVFLCYVFRCASESLVEEVMQTLKQAFHAAYQQSAKNHVVCELCPMHQLHKLCQEIDKQPGEKVHEILIRRIEQLNEKDRQTIFTEYGQCAGQSIQEKNELLMSILRHMSEEKQRHHIHLSDTNKARSEDSSLGTTPDTTPVASPLIKEFQTQFPSPFFEQRSPVSRVRSYSATLPPTQDPAQVTNVQSQYGKIKDDVMKRFGDASPLKTMFNKVTSSMTPASSPQSPSPQQSGYFSPLGKGSWRMDILSRVVTPSKTPRQKVDRGQHKPDEESGSTSEEEQGHKVRLRHLWKKAILETLLLIRMEKENKSLKARQDEVDTRRIKLDYEEITPCLKEVSKIWDKMLSNHLRAVEKFDLAQLQAAVKDGVPRAKRGDIWQLLVQQHKLHNPRYTRNPEDPEPSYEDLLKQLTTHQHAILIDLGRTFPGHPYFSNPLGHGQLALFNILKAYSLVDAEVGYCQGLSFVAGVLLMHMPEDAAFSTMKYMMSELGFRRQYKPDMIALQIQLYQLSRLLHDCHRDLYEHFEKHEIAPTLYAAPWFLTIFASQFPLGFVARVFDLIFLQGMEVVFKVALVLLGNHKELIKHCDTFELIMEFLKTTLPSMGIIQMERIINQVFQMDLSKDLFGYEVEYHVLQEEMQKTPHYGEDDINSQLEQANRSLKQQNLELLEQLQTSRSQCHSLEMQLHNARSDQNKLKSHIRTLELERAALLNAVSKLRKLIPEEMLESSDLAIPALDANKTITNSPIHNPLVNRFMEDLDVKFTSSSLTEFDKEVAVLMAARHRKLSDQGREKMTRAPPQSTSNEYLTVEAPSKNERPASAGY